MAAKSVTIKLPEPHPAQYEILNDKSRFIVAFCGRRFGKTELGVDKILFSLARRPGMYWWVGLSWRSASMKRAWRLLKMRCRGWALKIHETEKYIELPGGSEIWMRTADNPSSLAGEGLRGCVLDEFSLMSEDVWTEYVRASLADFKGWALFIGVPKGMNWAGLLFLAAQEDTGGRWKAFQMPTTANPHIDPDEVADAQRDLTERVYQQEFLAILLQDGGAIFRFLKEASTAVWQDSALPFHTYLISCDWAKFQDYSVFTVIDCSTKEVCHLDHSGHVDYTLQMGRLQALCEKFRPVEVVSEVTGNTALNEFLRQLTYSDPTRGQQAVQLYMASGFGELDVAEQSESASNPNLPIVDFNTTNSSKEEAIQATALAFERRWIRIPPEPKLLGQLQAYTCERLPGGGLRYGAPKGMHDDFVSSLIMGWHRARRYMSGETLTPAEVVKREVEKRFPEKARQEIAADTVAVAHFDFMRHVRQQEGVIRQRDLQEQRESFTGLGDEDGPEWPTFEDDLDY